MHAAPQSGRLQGAATRRSGATARSCNTASDHFAGQPEGFKREGRIAALQRLHRGPPCAAHCALHCIPPRLNVHTKQILNRLLRQEKSQLRLATAASTAAAAYAALQKPKEFSTGGLASGFTGRLAYFYRGGKKSCRTALGAHKRSRRPRESGDIAVPRLRVLIWISAFAGTTGYGLRVTGKPDSDSPKLP